MAEQPDITVHLPREYFDALSEVIFTGLQRAKISGETRNALRDWWTAEKEFVEEEMEQQ